MTGRTGRWYAVAIVICTLAAVGCGSVPPPSDRMASAEAALRGASEVGAAQVPRAGLYLRLAEEQIDKAKRYVQDGYNQRAELALRRAQADAELALTLAREQHTADKLASAQQNLEQLKAQYGRKP